MNFFEMIWNFLQTTGFFGFVQHGVFQWQNLVMILLALVLIFLAIKKGFEPYLLLPIAFGMLLVNLPGVKDEVFKEAVNYTMNYNGQILTFDNLIMISKLSSLAIMFL